MHDAPPIPSHSIGHWIGFLLFVLAMLALDLGVVHRKAHEIKLREALAWTAIWIGLSLGVGAAIYFRHGERSFLEYLTSYLVEKALSVDNLFIFIALFSYFSVPRAAQHRVLYWGIFGALVLRGAFIVGGTVLLQRFHWLMYLFGAALLVAALRMFSGGE